MPDATPNELDTMAAHLRTGPIVIGESHHEVYAREAIVYLIVVRAVRFLSVEAPLAPDAITENDGSLSPQHRKSYFEKADIRANAHYTMKRLAKIAMARQIPVHCHDLPWKFSRVRNLATDHDTYYTQVRNYYQSALPRSADKLTGMLVARNAVSGAYIQQTVAQQDPQLQGLVILAGDHHTLADQCGDNVANTIQGQLNIANNRVYHLS